MAFTVPIQYGVTFGKCDSSDWIDSEVDLTAEEEKIYREALKNGDDLNDVDGLEDALQRASDEIEEVEIENGLDIEDEFVMECQGTLPMDPDEINDLVAERDAHALAFFGLEGRSDDELDEWDANDLETLPLICDFFENFQPESPFDNGWSLNVVFVQPNDDDASDAD